MAGIKAKVTLSADFASSDCSVKLRRDIDQCKLGRALVGCY